MKAALLYEGGEVQVDAAPEPAPDGWELVETKAAGVCGTELHFVDGTIPPPAYPFQLGHEAASVVVSAPEQARAKLDWLADEGVRSLSVFPLGPDRRGTIARFAELAIAR